MNFIRPEMAEWVEFTRVEDTEQHSYAARDWKKGKEWGCSLALALPSHLQDGAPVCYRLPLCSWNSELPKFGCRFAVQKYAVDRMVFVPEDLRISSLPNLPADQRNESGKLRDRGRSGVHVPSSCGCCQGVLQGRTKPDPRWQVGTTDRAYIWTIPEWQSEVVQACCMAFSLSPLVLRRVPHKTKEGAGISVIFWWYCSKSWWI